MKGKSESDCHNYIRVGAPLKNGATLVCGTHAFSPQCREYAFNYANEGGGGAWTEREQFNGVGISAYDPGDNSTYVYNAETNEIFVGTVADFGGADPLIYRKRLPKGESLRTPKDERVIERE